MSIYCNNVLNSFNNEFGKTVFLSITDNITLWDEVTNNPYRINIDSNQNNSITLPNITTNDVITQAKAGQTIIINNVSSSTEFHLISTITEQNPNITIYPKTSSMIIAKNDLTWDEIDFALQKQFNFNNKENDDFLIFVDNEYTNQKKSLNFLSDVNTSGFTADQYLFSENSVFGPTDQAFTFSTVGGTLISNTNTGIFEYKNNNTISLTMQSAYDNTSSNPTFFLNSTKGPLSVLDNGSTTSNVIFDIENNALNRKLFYLRNASSKPSLSMLNAIDQDIGAICIGNDTNNPGVDSILIGSNSFNSSGQDSVLIGANISQNSNVTNTMIGANNLVTGGRKTMFGSGNTGGATTIVSVISLYLGNGWTNQFAGLDPAVGNVLSIGGRGSGFTSDQENDDKVLIGNSIAVGRTVGKNLTIGYLTRNNGGNSIVIGNRSGANTEGGQQAAMILGYGSRGGSITTVVGNSITVLPRHCTNIGGPTVGGTGSNSFKTWIRGLGNIGLNRTNIGKSSGTTVSDRIGISNSARGGVGNFSTGGPSTNDTPLIIGNNSSLDNHGMIIGNNTTTGGTVDSRFGPCVVANSSVSNYRTLGMTIGNSLSNNGGFWRSSCIGNNINTTNTCFSVGNRLQINSGGAFIINPNYGSNTTTISAGTVYMLKAIDNGAHNFNEASTTVEYFSDGIMLASNISDGVLFENGNRLTWCMAEQKETTGNVTDSQILHTLSLKNNTSAFLNCFLTGSRRSGAGSSLDTWSYKYINYAKNLSGTITFGSPNINAIEESGKSLNSGDPLTFNSGTDEIIFGITTTNLTTEVIGWRLLVECVFNKIG